MNIGEIPAKHAYHRPGTTAIVDVPNGRRITYGALDEAVRRTANGLRDGLGLAAGDRVAVLSRNSIEYQTLFFACARAGLITQPLNWRLAPSELARILADGEPGTVVVADELRPVGDELRCIVDGPHWLEYGPEGDGSFEAMVDKAPADEPRWAAAAGGDDPVFILYTGGTTGDSKGALHSHRSVATGMLNQTVAERIVPTDVYLLTGQMFHIPIVLAMNYMAHGCPLVLMNFEARLALEVIEAERVSAFLAITTMLNWMMAVDEFDRFDLSSLRNIQYGGGPMPSSIVKAALETFPCTLIQGYGQTEGTTMCFLAQEDHAAAVEGVHPERLRSCGREAFATLVRIVDADGRPVPRNGVATGEIVVRSEANMLGYWRRPDLTEATIRDGWLHTGDIASWDDDGYVFIADRAKDVIITGGENVYSVQVEEAIARHPAVLECAVIGVPDDEWGESVKAFVVLKPGLTATEDEIVATARAHLASYQKPRSVEFVADLPKAPTGKIIKRDLRDPYWAGRDRQV